MLSLIIIYGFLMTTVIILALGAGVFKRADPWFHFRYKKIRGNRGYRILWFTVILLTAFCLLEALILICG